MKKVLFVFFILAFFIPQKAKSQDEMFKALFMYNFTKYIEWPSGYSQGDFVIAVVGSPKIVQELNKIAEQKKVGGQNIVVEAHNSVVTVAKCNMVYLAENKSGMLPDLIAAMGSKPIVLITDKDGLALQGAGINYVKVDGKQKFEISPNNLKACGLKVSSSLIALGIEVN